MTIADTDAAYLSGLFAGTGSVDFEGGGGGGKRHKGKPGYRLSNSMRINMEITMTDYSVLLWVHETLGCGTLRPKKVKGKRKDGTPYLKQWKWRATFRDAYYVCLLIWPWSHVKLEKIQKIIQYYSDNHLKEGNIIDLEEVRLQRKGVL